MKNILITGGAGFIGSNLAKAIEKKFPECGITIFDYFNNNEKRSNGNYQYFGDYKNIIGLKSNIIIGDISNEKDVLRLLKGEYDVIFHQGAISDTTVLNQEQVLKTNLSTFNLFLEYCKSNSSKLVYASSAGTYGNSISPNIIGAGEFPENIYGFSKLSMDELARSFIKKNSNIHIVGLRYFNVYGPGELYKRRTSSMILQLARQAINKKQVKLFKFGEQKRDFVYIKDVIQANINAAKGVSGIYNVGSGQSSSFLDIVRNIEFNINEKISINFIDNPYTFYQNNTLADLSKSKEGINYQPKYNLELGIKNYMETILNYTTKDWNDFEQ
jgi:ADP-L-glycero-D-manno-heptose 6-epimerase